MPAEVYQLGTTYQVGAPVAEHKAGLVRLALSTTFFLTLGVIFLPFSIVGIFARSGFRTGVILLLLSLTLLGYGISRARTLLRNRGMRVYRCMDGLLHVKGATVEAICWDQVAEVWQTFRSYWLLNFFLSFSRRERTYYYHPFYTFKAYVLRRPDGTELVLDKAFRKFKELGTTLEQEVTRRLLPGVIAACNTGTFVNFGPISVSSQGIIARGNTLPWNELGRVYVSMSSASITIRKRHKLLNWANFRLWEVPNLCVFRAFADYMRSGQQLQQR